MKSSNILNQTVFQHVIFWSIYFLFNVIRWGLFFDDFEYSLQSNILEFCIHILIVYFNFFVLMPRFFPRKMTVYVISLLLATIAVSSLRIWLNYQLVTTEIWKEADVPDLNLFDPNYFMAVFIGEVYVVGLTLAIKLAIDYVKNSNQTKELETKKMEAELSFLRSQIQPHFFFNTLNNLYSLALTKSDKTPETILKLSDLMSYVIYKGKSKRVELRKEIKHISDYLDLEKLRYGKKLNASLEINGEMDELFIPPLILLPFVENCFKHGNTEQDEFPIGISVIIKDKKLIYSVQNEINKTPFQRPKDKRGGVGMKNVQRRLNLLFKDNYSLKVDQTQEIFRVQLTMPLYDKMSDS